MKSSLAKTFRDIAEGSESADRIFSSANTVRSIKNENGDNLPPEHVLVLEPYDEYFGHPEKTSTLLVNDVLRREYEQLHRDLNRSRRLS